MTIEKLPSGSYRVKMMVDGITYRATVDHKPSKSEATQLIAMQMKSVHVQSMKLEFRTAARKYIDSKSQSLSPSTIRGYESVLRNIPDYFMDKDLDKIDSDLIQRVIDEYAVNHSPKSTYNLHGFISAILGKYRPDLTISTSLPRKRPNKAFCPLEDDVSKVMNHIKEKYPRYYVPIALCCLSLRRSEVCALEYPQDLKGNILYVNKAKVQDKDGNWHIKTTKTTASERQLYLPDELVKIIHEQECFFEGNPGMLNKVLVKAVDEVGVDHFSLHKLRHYFAAKMCSMTDLATAEKMGGWTPGSQIMRKAYDYSLANKEKQKKLMEDMMNF